MLSFYVILIYNFHKTSWNPTLAYFTTSSNYHNWLVVWDIWFIFPYIGNVIILPDELIFFRGVAQPPTRQKGGRHRPSPNKPMLSPLQVMLSGDLPYGSDEYRIANGDSSIDGSMKHRRMVYGRYEPFIMV